MTAKRKPKSATKARPQSAPRRLLRGARHLLAAVRRPRAAKPRGPARARVAPVRRPARSGAPGQNGTPAAQYEIRDFAAGDANAVNAVALAAFEQYRGEYSDWTQVAQRVGAMAEFADDGEIIVALREGRILGAVAYFSPRAAKPEMFDPAWPVIRMLVVDPAERGHGIGRALTEECIRRARRDGAAAVALHTSPIMQVALAMYLRLGFVPLRPAPPVFGVPYRIYLKRL